jgi:NAD/NADP transhydrogenase beta subunit
MTALIDFSVIAVLIIGIRQFREPSRAKIGNWLAALALGLAFVLVIYRHGIVDIGTVLVALALGATFGYLLAKRVNMIHMPAMVAFQHGAGGVAAFLVSLVELTRATHPLPPISELSGVLGLIIGSLTFSGSMIASAKLANKMRQAPQVLAFHNGLVWLTLVAMLVVAVASFTAPSGWTVFLYLVEIALGTGLGILLAMRIGGADMPVLISTLNATAGLAASLCGMVIANQLLIAFGATVAASGSILTYVMCKAMNRKFSGVLFPGYTPAPSGVPKTAEKGLVPAPAPIGADTAVDPAEAAFAEAVKALDSARTVVVIPGYGMALAKAQQEVALLAALLTTRGKTVKYAIHPVAGRMPGHMNVLLAEAGVDYEMLIEMDEINPEFRDTDCVVVVGACDVVNPAAIEVEGTPISGMPILMAHQARRVVCCNFDRQPGYSGVANSLYGQENSIFLEGDAQRTVRRLIEALGEASGQVVQAGPEEGDQPHRKAVAALDAATSIIIIPGYGMALAKAQFTLVELADLLRQRGAAVKYAIHPVAGRMPGHMNVLLAEADVDYEDLLDLEEVNPQFATTDVVMVVGACDVVNPAAMDTEGTPISGMPVLLAREARRIIVCNFDRQPGYSGVPNPLYENEKTIMLTGDANQTIAALLTALQKV